MLIYDGNKIRVTRKELAFFFSETGRSKPPRTVEEYNEAFEEAAAYCEADGSPEGRLLAAFLRGEKIQQDAGNQLSFTTPYFSASKKFSKTREMTGFTEEDYEFLRSFLR